MTVEINLATTPMDQPSVETNTHEKLPSDTDVLIIGAGPIGLLCAYQLSKFSRGKIRVVVVDKEEKSTLPIYGRACTILPRTLEMWDQLGILDEMLDEGVVSKTGYNFKDGQIVKGGLSFLHRMDRHGDTNFNFALHLRQRIIEQIIEAKWQESTGQKVYQAHELLDYTDDSETGATEYPIKATIMNNKTGESGEIRARYIIGSDGGKSKVRKIAGIPFTGTSSAYKWVRMDAVVKTNMPSPRCLNSVQSTDHGLLLWCPIDNRRTRIGYVFSKEIQDKWALSGEGEGVTREAVETEAKLAVRPFELEFEEMDWFTVYGIGQRIAQDFVKGRTILVGDACHTHSSGSAQGLNTGSHDAINLSWKLSLILQGLAGPKLLESYARERKAMVQKVIDNDTIVSTLISGEYPEKYKDRAASQTTKEILDEWFENTSNLSFTLGLGVAYETDDLLNVSANKSISTVSSIAPGHRGPNAVVSRVGTGEELMLSSIIRNGGKFNVVVFTGDPHHTKKALKTLREELGVPREPTALDPYVTFTTLVLGQGIGSGEVMGCQPYGRAYFDHKRQAHESYGIDDGRGAVLVFRPDGHLGIVLDLAAGHKGLVTYLAGFSGKI